MKRSFLLVIVGVLCGLAIGLAYHWMGGWHPQESQKRDYLSEFFPPALPAVVGRFQIVNGTPTLTRNIMLLDTMTGDSWQICEAPDGTTTWCSIPKSTGTATGPNKK